MTSSVEKPSNGLIMPFFSGIAGGIGISYLDRRFFELGKYLFPSIKEIHQISIEKTLKVSKSKFSPSFVNFKKIGICTVVPLFEELIFRKYLRDSQLNDKLPQNESFLDKMKRIGINSGLFAAAHIQWNSSIKNNAVLCTSIFSSGMVYNLLMDKYGILSPVIAHCFGNFFGIRALSKKI